MRGILAVVLTAAVTAVPGVAAAEAPVGTVQIGGLLSLSGSSGSSGVQMDAAARLAIDDFNAYLTRTGTPWHLEWVPEDIRTDPDVALEVMQDMDSRGIGIVIGPDTSAALEQVLEYVNGSGMLVVSPSSTAPGLAIPDDAVFRLAPSDAGQGRALGKILDGDGVRVVVPLWRGDAYGDGLKAATERDFEGRGGTVHTGVRYDPATPDHSLEVRLLDKYVAEASRMYGADNVAVLVIAFDEISSIVQAAARYDNLEGVRWYGDESAVYGGALPGEGTYADFLAAVEFRAVRYLLTLGDMGPHVKDAIAAEFGEGVSQYVYPTYDAVWVVGKAIQAANSTDAADVAAALQEVADTHAGALGSTRLNGAGDLDLADYAVRSAAGGYWEREATYLGAYDILAPAVQPGGEVAVGILLPTTASSRAAENLAATNLGVYDLNAFLNRIGAGWQMALEEPPPAEAATALDGAKHLHTLGVDIIIGPGTSDSAKEIKPYADANGMVMLSCCSTAPSLAIPNDSLYRLVPDDSQQGVALGKLLHSEGMAAAVPIWVDDPYGNGLHGAFSEDFESRGGTLGSGIRYGPDQEVSAKDVSGLASEVAALAAEHGADRVAVLMISHAESADVVLAASHHDILSDVRWFGSETVVGRASLMEGDLAGWVEGVGLTAVQVTENPGPLYGRVQAHVLDGFGQAVNAYIYPSYDAAWLVGLSILQEGAADAMSVRSALGGVAAGYSGAVANIVLNEAGDLASSDYGVWRVAGGAWVETARYSLAADTITPHAP